MSESIFKFSVLPAVFKAAAAFAGTKRRDLAPAFYVDRGGVYLAATDSATLFAYRVANNPAGIESAFIFSADNLKKINSMARGCDRVAVALYFDKIVFSAGGASIEAPRLSNDYKLNWRRALFGVALDVAHFLRDRVENGTTPAPFIGETLARVIKGVSALCVSTRLIMPCSSVAPLLIVSEDRPDMIAAIMPRSADPKKVATALDATAAAFDLED